MPLRPCLGLPGVECRRLAEGTRCPEHAAAYERERNRRRDAARGSSTERGYGADWRRISAQVIAEEGCCRDCGTTGTPDNPLTCDHVIARVHGGTNDRANLVCRCRKHNSARGGRTRGRRCGHS